MPAASATRETKRKREVKREAPQKRARSESGDDEGDEQDADRGQILLLESEILESKKNYNNIVTLITTLQGNLAKGDETAVFAAVSLCRVFYRLLASGNFVHGKNAPAKEIEVTKWLRKRLSEYKEALREMFARDEWALTAMKLSMKLLAAEAQYGTDKDDYNFPRSSLAEIVQLVLAQRQTVDGLLEEFVETVVDEYDDVRFYTFKVITEQLSSSTSLDTQTSMFDDAYELLASIECVPDSNKDIDKFFIPAPKNKSHAVFNASQHRKQAQDAWLALLRLNLTKDQKKKMLDVMASVVAPRFSKPELLMDFLTDCYNAGGSISLLALSGVFYLIQERNLDYPAFYRKLYTLLDNDILHSKHRSRFFRLLDTFLASSHLPAQLVASFIKRLCRLCLNAPPSAIVTVVPWIYNLFKKHPQCTFMLHRVPRTQAEKDALQNEGLDDPFREDEQDPMETQAIDSCLWEIVQLQAHYHPNVATIAKIISEQFTKQFYSLEDFLDHSYGSLIDAELSKNVKKAPAIEYMIPKRVLLPQDADAEAKDSLLVRLWNFT